ncbi:tRNA preQ1(34) S-adenosylmethionine ribosyltransferase-isomerase QueA [Brockia lithotrophica]|uniref:S-adenosylmethionine:tRNA ribosyltransferase-isomerase n=1 Tax=Brockia lithotrophica TaxID=933949 RepID=A0A660L6U8_9BACL|nr:tRNA preQ1(34) S-adenosylmethionine ribosyltransferase-isomerase QueA [Brockia lithotrophica]RKQ89055.1 S-adenosylmethionine--tRNA ribosyltransferase-isomerase [Brockia lithotrophica]
MKLSDFDYELPEELIAQEPLPERDASRLMVLYRAEGRWEHRRFRELPNFLRSGDVLVFNDSRVIPARLYGRKADTGARVELLLVEPRGGPWRWKVLARPARRLRPGTVVEILPVSPEASERASAALRAVVEEALDGGVRVVRFDLGAGGDEGDFFRLLERVGRVPLPPYVRRELRDPERYQTVYARERGSVAAPTAGLHFTPELLSALAARGVTFAYVTLHVGLGTFRPVTEEDPTRHRMHEEPYRLPPETAEVLETARREGRMVLAVGTTSLRVLETVYRRHGRFVPEEGVTDLFLYPGIPVRSVQGLLTNFHLPRSTLLMLVAAFAGYELTMAAYRAAVRERYRFFSFGDAMLIV